MMSSKKQPIIKYSCKYVQLAYDKGARLLTHHTFLMYLQEKDRNIQFRTTHHILFTKRHNYVIING